MLSVCNTSIFTTRIFPFYRWLLCLRCLRWHDSNKRPRMLSRIVILRGIRHTARTKFAKVVSILRLDGLASLPVGIYSVEISAVLASSNMLANTTQHHYISRLISGQQRSKSLFRVFAIVAASRFPRSAMLESPSSSATMMRHLISKHQSNIFLSSFSFQRLLHSVQGF